MDLEEERLVMGLSVSIKNKCEVAKGLKKIIDDKKTFKDLKATCEGFNDKWKACSAKKGYGCSLPELRNNAKEECETHRDDRVGTGAKVCLWK